MKDLTNYRNKPIAFTWAMYKPYIKWFILAAVSLEIYHVLTFFVSYPLKLLIDRLPTFSQWSDGLFVVILLAAIFLVMDIGLRLTRFFWLVLEKNVRLDVSKQVIEYTLNHSTDYFSKRMAGSIVNRNLNLLSSMNSIVEDVALYGILPGITSIIVSISIFSSLNNLLLLIFVVWIVPFIVVIYLLTGPLERAAEAKAETQSEYVGKLSDTISNQSIIKYFGGEQGEYDRLSPALIRATDAWIKEIQIWEWSQFARNLLILLLHASIYLALIYLFLRGEISLGDTAFSVGVIVVAADSVKNAAMSVSSYFGSKGVLKDNLNDILQPHEIKDEEGVPNLEVKDGKIKMEGVSFSYENGKRVFDGLSLEILPKQKIGIVGTSGAGKSTLISILLRLHSIERGIVTIDDQDIYRVSQDSLRKNISFIPQDVSLFHRSIKENIAYGKENATDQEIIQAAKLAQADDFIMKMPDGYDSIVGERGVLLSGGQRQRIAIARAFIKNAPILIMDEATSALDSESEAAIQQALERLMTNKTVLVVAHRLSTLQIMDRIIVLEKGKVKEDGTHQALLKQNGVYAKLWNQQSGGVLPEEFK